MSDINYDIDITQAPFLFLNHHPSDYFSTLSKQLNVPGKVGDDLKFRNFYMGDRNVAYINNQIQKQVYKNSCHKYIIGDQKYEHLYLVMEQIYDNNARHINAYKKEELAMLNKLVIDLCSNVAIEEITHRYKSLQSRLAKPTVMPDPVNCSTKGTKSHASRLSFKHDKEGFNVEKRIKDKDVYSRSIMVDDESIDKYCGNF